MSNENIPHRPKYLLTTYDNPFNPYTHWDEWFAWDQSAGYNTPGLLARIVRTSNELSEVDQSLAIQQAIEEIVRENVSGMHRRIAANDSVSNEDTDTVSVSS